jgi:large repetitive protein
MVACRLNLLLTWLYVLGGYIPVAGCPIGLLGAAKSCFKEFFLKNAYILAALQGNETIPPIIRQSLLDMTYFLDMHDALIGGMNEYIGNEDWRDKNSFHDFLVELNAVSEPNTIITHEQILAVKQKMSGSDVTDSDIDDFVTRWNNTVEAYSKGIYSPTTEYPNIINNIILEEMVEKQDLLRRMPFQRDLHQLANYSTMR